MIVLLECIDLFTMCMNIMLDNNYSVDSILNALPTFTITKILGVSLQFTHRFVIHLCIRNACNTDFHLFIVLGDKLIHYISLYIRSCLKVSTFVFKQKFI